MEYRESISDINLSVENSDVEADEHDLIKLIMQKLDMTKEEAIEQLRCSKFLLDEQVSKALQYMINDLEMNSEQIGLCAQMVECIESGDCD
jgi:hypothetical protein